MSLETKGKISGMVYTFRAVFSRPGYIILAVVTAFLLPLLAIWLTERFIS